MIPPKLLWLKVVGMLLNSRCCMFCMLLLWLLLLLLLLLLWLLMFPPPVRFMIGVEFVPLNIGLLWEFESAGFDRYVEEGWWGNALPPPPSLPPPFRPASCAGAGSADVGRWYR